MNKSKTVKVERCDLIAAWAVLENLAVSLDQIGSVCAGVSSRRNGVSAERVVQKALATYLKPELVHAIGAARARLGQYVSDEEAEKIAASIPYWDYQTTGARNVRKA